MPNHIDDNNFCNTHKFSVHVALLAVEKMKPSSEALLQTHLFCNFYNWNNGHEAEFFLLICCTCTALFGSALDI